MSELKSLKEANEVSAVRLVSKRQRAKVGDIFRLSPCGGVFLWGRLIKRAKFFGVDGDFNLVYIYDTVGRDRPSPQLLSPQNLMIGPSVVNYLGWPRGYWEIVASEPVKPEDMLDHHFFLRNRGMISTRDIDIVDEQGRVVRSPRVGTTKLAHAGFGNFNSVDWELRTILRERGLIRP
jgi:immunity protein 26 of polymorphic toxin system